MGRADLRAIPDSNKRKLNRAYGLIAVGLVCVVAGYVWLLSDPSYNLLGPVILGTVGLVVSALGLGYGASVIRKFRK